ncbi:5093_t:CDS:2 [Rhizophagus irregularis]|nr:5093_t:CDS:2 [Rhizophagus irregularis]
MAQKNMPRTLITQKGKDFHSGLVNIQPGESGSRLHKQVDDF